MAGYSKIYVIGGRGGSMGADGVNPIALMILVGDADRQWLEPVYVDKRIRPLGKVKTLVPESPDAPASVLDACLAFFPGFFTECPSLLAAERELGEANRIDFDLNENVPACWAQLRQEAAPLMKRLGIWTAELEEFTYGG